MRLRYLLAVASVLTLVSQGLAQGCEGWNTREFFTWVATPEKVADCLAAGARVDVRSEHGFTPLHFAAAHSGKVAGIYGPAVIRTLIQAGAWVGARSSGGLTPLHFAAGENENPAVITALLDVGADATVQDNSSNTPWDYAQDNEALRGTDAWWRLNEGRFQ